MAEIDAGSGPSDAPHREVEVEASDAGTDSASQARSDASSTEGDAGHAELRAMRARKTLEEEAEAARRRVLGSHRGRARTPTSSTATAPDDDVDPSEHLRQLVRGVEEETERLQEDLFRLRSAAGRAGATLQEEIQRAADELAEETVEEFETTVGQTTTESLEALTAAVDNLHETATALNEVAAGLRTSTERLGNVAPMAERLAQLAAAPPVLPDALAGILRDLTDQLGALGDAVS